MTKWIMIILAISAVLYLFPDARQAILEKAQPMWAPVREWTTESEMDDLVTDLRLYQVEHNNRLPVGRDWSGWLAGNYSRGDDMDAWGSRYRFLMRGDSFYVRSLGPDRTPGTGDDLFAGSLRFGTR